MVVMALLALVVLLLTRDIRFARNFIKRQPEAITVPFFLRFALGVYIIVLVYTVVRGWRQRAAARRGQPIPPAEPTRLSIPVIAAIGVILVVLVLWTGREPSSRKKEEPSTRTVHTVAPEKLDGVGFVPEKADMIAGVHIAELWEKKGSEKELERILLVNMFKLDRIQKWTGLSLDDLDHVVLWWQTGKPLHQPNLVIRTKQSFKGEAICQTDKLKKLARRGEGILYSFRWDEGATGLLWDAGDQHTIIVVFIPGDIDDVPLQPRSGSKKIPWPLRALFKQRRMFSGTPVWFAGRPKNSSALRRVKILSRLVKRDQEAFSAVDGFQAMVLFDGKFTLLARFHTSSTKAAEKLEASFRALHLEGSEVKVSLSKDNWLDLQAKGSDMAILAALAKVQKK
jgi:hypothetical protein